jgi:sterol 14alpha-demethylase
VVSSVQNDHLTLFLQVIPQDPKTPPVVFHWLPVLGSAIEYGNDPVNFLARCRAKVSLYRHFIINGFAPVYLKHGDVFTFVLLGRRVTVCLGPKGNNFILGGRLSEVSAEDVYSVNNPFYNFRHVAESRNSH